MDFMHFTAGADDADRRLDKVIRRFLGEASLSSLYKSLRKGLIKVNGAKSSADYRICEGDDIQIAAFLTESSAQSPSDGKSGSKIGSKALDRSIVVFRNENLLVLNKPYDVPVQPSPSSRPGESLSEMVSSDYAFLHPEQSSLSFRTGPLHRLDRKTTGLIAFSQSAFGARRFSELIKSHGIKKSYVALVSGRLDEAEEWHEEISRDERGDKKSFHTVKIFEEDTGMGKSACTKAAPLAHGILCGKEVTLAQFVISSGRTHQIRSQAAFHSHPLVGDTAYGGDDIRHLSLGQDFFLHAYELRFPADGMLGTGEVLRAFISTKFQKMLNSALIKWDGSLII